MGLFVLGSIALLAVHVVFGHDDYDLWARVFAALSGIVALAFAVRTRPGTLPFSAYAATLLYLSFGAGTFTDADFHGALGPIPIERASLTAASFAALLVVVATTAVLPLGRRLGRLAAPSLARVSPGPPGPGFLHAAYVTSAMIAVAGTFVTWRAGNLPAALAFPAFVLSRPALAQGILVAAAKATGRQRPRQFAVVLTAMVSLAGLSAGSMSPALTPWVSLAMLSWVIDGRAPWRPAAFVIALMLVLNPAKYAYRDIVWFGGGARDFSLVERASIWEDAVIRTWSGDAEQSSKNLESTTDRIGLLVYGAQGIEWVPSPVPEAGFRRWLDIPSAFIPRFLWSEKPDLTVENNVAYTVAFGLQTSMGSRSTTIAFPIMVDGFWTAGYLGVTVAGAILGLLYGFLEGILVTTSWATLIVGVTMLTTITPATHLAASITGVPQTVAGSLVVMWITWIVARAFDSQTRSPQQRSAVSARGMGCS